MPFPSCLRSSADNEVFPIEYLSRHLINVLNNNLTGRNSTNMIFFICNKQEPSPLPSSLLQFSWLEDSGRHHPLPSLAPSTPNVLSHINLTGPVGSSWIDQVLLKGSAPITLCYLSIDQGCFWLGHSDHRLITAAYFSPLFSHLTALSFPKNLFCFPAPSIGKHPKDVKSFGQKCTASSHSDPPSLPSAECQAALDHLHITSRATIPKHALHFPKDTPSRMAIVLSQRFPNTTHYNPHHAPSGPTMMWQPQFPRHPRIWNWCCLNVKTNYLILCRIAYALPETYVARTQLFLCCSQLSLSTKLKCTRC